MRLQRFSRGASAAVLSAVMVTGPVFAAPSMPSGASIVSDTTVDIQPAVITNSLDMQPVASLPGKIGSLTYDSDGRCIVIVLGGHSTLSGGEVRALFFGDSARKNYRPIANSQTLIMCPAADGVTEVVLANQAGVKKLTAPRGRPRANGSSIISTSWSGPNKLATALLGRRVVTNGAKFISNEYDVHFGTDGAGKIYFLILDRAANKFVAFHQDQGGYHTDLTPAVIDLIHDRLGRRIAQAPRIMVAD